MTHPIWKVQYCQDFNALYDRWLLAAEDQKRQYEAAAIWAEMDKHKVECTKCVREPNTQY